MSTSKHPDPLDQKIDALLASQPLQPSPGFSQSVLRAAQDLTRAVDFDSGIPPTQARHRTRARSRSRLVRFALGFALPAAAGVALALWVSQNPAEAPAPEVREALFESEVQEIFLLEDTLYGLQGLSSDGLINEDLFFILDPLFLEIES